MITDSTRPIFETSVTEWLDELPAYNLTEDTSALLDLYREIWDSNQYYWMGVPFPTNIVGTGTGIGPGNILNFGPGETQTGSINVPVGSYLTSIGGLDSALTPGAQNPVIGFKYRLYDKGAQTDLFYGTYALAQTAASDGDAITLNPTTYPFGPHLLQSPLIVLPPGLLQIEITNLDNLNAATIQMFFAFACPCNSKSLNNVVQERTK